jgi:hypothetical protein
MPDVHREFLIGNFRERRPCDLLLRLSDIFNILHISLRFPRVDIGSALSPNLA